MKILFAIDTLGKGGAERVITNLANYFIKENDVSIMTLRNVPTEYELNEKISIVNIQQDGKYKNKIIREIKNINKIKHEIERSSPDIIITFLPAITYRLMIANIINKKKVIISVRNDPKIEYNNIIKKTLMKILYTRANGFIFQTEEAKSFFSKKIQMKSEIIPNPINESFIEKPFGGERKKEIVSVGRLEEQKNHKMLIKAFSRISEEYKDYKLIIYGEGNERENLEKLITDLNLVDKVLLPGKVDNIKEKIYNASAFILSSDYEGMPNALMEAMALGIPVISTNCPCGGPRFLINNNKNGILVPIKDEEKMKIAIEKLLGDRKFANSISTNASKISIELHPKKINKKWENFIKERMVKVNDKKVN